MHDYWCDRCQYRTQPPTSPHVRIATANNATFQDAFEFDPPPGITGITGGTGPYWTFNNQNFRLDIKSYLNQTVPLLSLTSVANQIIVDSISLRVLHFNVPESVLQAAMPPGEYIYDFIMYDNSVPPIRVPLMHGEFILTDGITGG